MKKETINLNLLSYSWTAEVVLNNGQVTTIWWTAWSSLRRFVADVNWVSSDIPRHKITPVSVNDFNS